MGARFSIGTIAAATRKRFYDSFTRTDTSGSLGTATDGSKWNAIRGTFTVATNKASSGSDANYPMATQSMPTTNVSVSLQDVTQGASVALWAVDSANWWAVGVDRTVDNAYNCATCYNYNAIIAGNAYYNYVPGNAYYNYVPGNAYYNYVAGTYVGATCGYYQNSNGACPIA